ncbi:prepilin peptidase [Hyphococcus lacteus]|uniref:Prepilin leader peptidase/N-methyltransferase n=1 Tax=Hyphococcus lacteus TaxID=3143536 RepID=A0ABV3Z601_9PROT
MNLEWAIFITAFLVGLLAGSFLNVVIYRGPQMWNLIDGHDRGNLVFPRSSCPSCGAIINPLHLVPVAGFLWLRGRCGACKDPISFRYPVVELLGGLAVLVAVVLFGSTLPAGLAALFFLFLIALAAIDYETGYLPDALTLPLIMIGIAANGFELFVPFADAIIGAFVGYLVFRAIDFAFLKLRGVEGLGQGDAKLLAAIGAWLGWVALAPTVFIAAILGLVAVGIMRLKGQAVSGDMAIAFGPALAGAAAIMMIASGLISL